MLKSLMDKYFTDVLKESPEIETEITTLFESAVSEKVNASVEAKEKALEEGAEVKLTEFKTSIVDKLDEYINLSMDEFVEEHETKINGGLKVDLAEKTLSAIKTIFVESTIDMPESEQKLVSDLNEKVESVNTKLNEKVNENIDLTKQIFEFEKAIKFEHSTKEMTLVDKEKLMTLVENIDCDTIEDFETKVKILKENVFTVDEKKEEKKELKEDGDSFKNCDLDKYLP